MYTLLSYRKCMTSGTVAVQVRIMSLLLAVMSQVKQSFKHDLKTVSGKLSRALLGLLLSMCLKLLNKK